jgi:hypothetical protein
LVALLVWAGGVGIAWPAASHVILLEQPQAPQIVKTHGWDRQTRPVTFTNEPVFSTRSVVRATLHLGRETNSTLAFAWDRGGGKLYVDLNRNFDLADDPGGCFTADPKTPSVFTNVHLALPTPAGPHPITLDLRLYLYQDPAQLNLSTYLTLRSFWQGKLEWQGREWQVGVVEQVGPTNSFGEPDYLVLRPWAERTNLLDFVQGTPGAVKYSRRLFWRGQAFQVDCSWGAEAGQPRYRLEFKEEPTGLAQLRIAGSNIRRLTLDNPAGFTAVLDDPDQAAEIPPGTYTLSEVWVKSGTNQAVATPRRQVTVDGKTPASLVAGGPLTNSVSVNRYRHDLVAAYQIVGADGSLFRRVPQIQDDLPEVTIFRGGKSVNTGKFRYG